jgi:hypothetical protein
MMTTASVAGMDAATSGAVQGVAKGLPVVKRHCDGCGALLLLQLEAEAVPRRWGDVWWCTQCLCSISAAEIDRQTQELPLRGVPLH